MLTFGAPGGRIGREPFENFDLETRRHAVDLLAHRAGITIDVNVSQFSARFLLNLRFGA
ncbi:MAG TPA: hypothetical protein VHT28_12460 [Silvibacterium sp.]|jgi:hypothetical protein|nr:hypothetical protein [Silvibacterium sp.]